ncbi:UNVERIFIED_CONTAM: hypothetical protein K2H54_056026 [Gekko kuhli]
MASPTEANESFFSDVRKVGYLRKPKSMHKRFFVLRAASESGPARLEYYENEKKWRHKSGAPKRSIPLESCFNINKRADSKNKHLVALYTKDEHFAIAADSEPEQESWYQALLQLHNRAKSHHYQHHHHHGDRAVGGGSVGMGEAGEENYGEMAPGPAFKEVWQVILKPKGLGQTKNLIGIYRLCLTNKTISFVKLNSDAAAVVLQLLNIRRCGHSENFFFIEVGRSAVTGPGEFWMQVDDSVVAQNMHETILEAMRAMSEEFRPRSKSQSSSNCSNPISVPLRSRHHVNNPPPSQVGLSRRSRTESVTATSPAGSGVGGGGGTGKPNSFRVRASSDGEGTMSRPASVDGSPQQTRYPGVPCCPRLGSEDAGDLDKGFRKRTHSAGTSPTISHQKTPSQSSVTSIEEYTEMLPSYSCSGSRLSSYRHSAFVPTHSYPEECLEMHHVEGSHHQTSSTPHTDDGYMPMLPGVAPVPNGGSAPKGGDYMPMSPKSVSAPQQIINPGRGGRHVQAMVDSNGYMMMSPSGSCSPDSGPTGYSKLWMNGTRHHPKLSVESNEGKLPSGGSDYINMSPASGSATSTPPDCYFTSTGPPGPEEPSMQGPTQSHHKPIYSYFSLPRSFKHVQRRTGEEGGTQMRMSLSSGRLLYAAAAEDSSSSTSSDSLGGPAGQEGGGFSVPPQTQPLQPAASCTADMAVRTKSRLARPTRLSLDGPKASTLPRAREQLPEPKSPGEYVNIEFKQPAFPSPSSHGDAGSSSEEYMNMDWGAACPSSLASVQSSRGGAVPTGGRDYMSMQVGSGGQYIVCAHTPSPSPPALLLSYADMRMGHGTPEKSPPAVGLPSPHPQTQPGELATALPHSCSSSMVGGLGMSSAFTHVSPSRSSQSAKVIRADPQGGRRRHSSETFASSTTPSGGLGASALPHGPGGGPDEAKRHSSASFENVWLKPGDLGASSGLGMAIRSEPAVGGTGGGVENGLNYIDLDLVKDFNHRQHHHPHPQESTSLLGGKQTTQQHQPPKSPNQPCGSSHLSDELSAYASISFHKREDIQ